MKARRILLIVIFALLSISGSVYFSLAISKDRITPPPSTEEFSSPNNIYFFKLFSPDNWKSRRSVGELYLENSESSKLLWRRTLPHRLRPRFIVVGNSGSVLMIDEWIKTATPYSIMLISSDNEIIAQYGFEKIQKIIDEPTDNILRAAKYGAWISSPPLLDTTGNTARIETSGKVLVIQLSDGKLSIEE